MKKVILILAMVSAAITIQAQQSTVWHKGEITDDFNDPTGETYDYLGVEGLFSNSATTETLCNFRFMATGKNLVIDVYEYGDKLANFQDAMGEIKVKMPDGNVYTHKAFFSRGQILLEAIITDAKKYFFPGEGIYKIAFNNPNDYSQAKYRMQFELKLK